MPWFNMRSPSEADVRVIYAWIRSLGPAGAPAPEALPPSRMPTTPEIAALPRTPGRPRYLVGRCGQAPRNVVERGTSEVARHGNGWHHSGG